VFAFVAAMAVAMADIPITDVDSVVTYARGFGEADIGGHVLTPDQVHHTLSHLNQVIVEQGASSFLELQRFDGIQQAENVLPDDNSSVGGMFASTASQVMANDRDQEEDDEIKYMQTTSQYPAKVTTGASVDPGRGPGPRKDDQGIDLDLGHLHLHLIKNLHARSLIRSVKWGTSAVPSWTEDYPVKRRPDEVHHHIVSFDGEPFVTRPIVLVSIMPVCDGDGRKCDENWTDVFAVSLSHISTNEFAVNIVRLDSMPNNTWGQQIHVAYVAFEPNDERAIQHDQQLGLDDGWVTMAS